jgi:three-Cys-motif partner protein
MATKKLKKIKAKQNVLPHSQAKLDLYKNYLGKYLNVLGLSTFIEKINLFDIFCGTGIYDDGKVGSPIIAFQSIKENREYFKKNNWAPKSIKLTVNDGKSENVQKVENYLNPLNQDICKLEFHQCDSSEMFKKVIDTVNKQTPKDRNLILIDPYGYKEIHKNDFVNLLKVNRTEIILFLPISQMYRFSETAINDEEELPHFEKLRNFIYEFFEESHPVRMGTVSDVFEYIQYIKEAFSFNNKYYTASYYIQRSSSSYYSLFFITHNLYGLEKILDAKWELDDGKGEGYEMKKPQMTMDFVKDTEKASKLNKLVDLLKGYLNNGKKRTNVEVYEFVLINEFLPKHANEIFRQWQDANSLKVWDTEKNKKARNNSFYINWDNYKDKKVKATFEITK